MVDSPSGLRTWVISRMAGLRKVSARFPFSSDRTATNVPLGETFAVFTFADRVNIARPVGSDETARGDAVSACLQDAASARTAISGMRRFIDVRLLLGSGRSQIGWDGVNGQNSSRSGAPRLFHGL